MVGRQALEIEFLKGALKNAARPRSVNTSVIAGPRRLHRRRMPANGIGRSAFYDTPDARARDLTIVVEMKTICDEFEAYGYRCVDAELRSPAEPGELPFWFSPRTRVHTIRAGSAGTRQRPC
jgi:hypothetical protein